MIDYKNISDSINYYNLNNFQRIEVPWTVSPYISNLTKPAEKKNFSLPEKNKVLIGSAEQGFLYLYLKEFLPKGKYQSVTPCFRDEEWDYLHTKYFIKNELIITDIVTTQELEKTVGICFTFFKSILDKYSTFDNSKLLIKKINDNSYDIEYNNIELGSYGIRENEFIKYIYATGCAEPRLSKTITLMTI